MVGDGIRYRAGIGERKRREGAIPAKQHHVQLTVEERHELEQMIRSGHHATRKLTRARILLKADKGLRDEDIAEAVETSVATIERVRQRFGYGLGRSPIDPAVGGDLS